MRHSRLFLFAMPLMAACMFISCNPQDNGPLPRGKASAEFDAAMV